MAPACPYGPDLEMLPIEDVLLVLMLGFFHRCIEAESLHALVKYCVVCVICCDWCCVGVTCELICCEFLVCEDTENTTLGWVQLPLLLGFHC